MIDPDLYAFPALWRHYRQCRRNKRNTHNALAFEINAEANLLALQQELRAHTYRPGRSICFVTDGPKPREVFAADFRDRVVHHLLVSHQERLFEPWFIHDSYACRTGKGTLAASDRLMTFLRQVTANGQRPAWALKLDVANFFPSIHKATLAAILARHLSHPELLWLTHTLLFHDPTTNYHFQSRNASGPGPGSPHYPVPPHKSLFGKHNEQGVPIGNLTSQFWGNVYLNDLDHFVKRTLKCQQYLRYVDYMVLLAPDPETLRQWCAAIAAFLHDRLHLTLRPELTTPFPVRQGIDFVGWRAWEALWQQYPWLAALFRRQDWALDIRWSPRRLVRLCRFQAQYGYVLRHTGDDCLVFFPYGRFLEFYGPQRLLAASALGLRPRALPRARYAFTAGFPVWLSGVYTSRAVRQGLIVVQFRQERAPLHHRCTLRLPCSLWLPITPGASGSAGTGHAP